MNFQDYIIQILAICILSLYCFTVFAPRYYSKFCEQASMKEPPSSCDCLLDKNCFNATPAVNCSFRNYNPADVVKCLQMNKKM